MTSREVTFSFLVLLVAIGLTAGCQRVHVGENDGGGSVDGGGLDGAIADASRPADSAVLTPCGPASCHSGQVCCNASCGICTEPGMTCTAIACTTECASTAECGAAEYCALSHCPDGTRDGTCAPRPEECTSEFAPVCGCDGATYSNDCSARSAGVVPARVGACTAPDCAAQDIRGGGACTVVLGVMWNGTACVGISGCDCVGADCASMYDTIVQCESVHSGCHSCAAQDARGEGPCDAEVGVFWNGTECAYESGCSCVGADCSSGWFDLPSCQAAHLHCSDTPTCRTNAECPDAFEFCSRPEGVCAGVGTCERIPGPIACTFEAPPVCGCDGVTYGCPSEANIAGTVVAHRGACELACGVPDVTPIGFCELLLGHFWNGSSCQALIACSCDGPDCASLTSLAVCERVHAGCGTTERTCGGIAGELCPSDEWCDHTADDCGVDDGLGVCRARPTSCTFLLDPHCTCDGTTYDNECFANMAGHDAARGACAPAPGGG